MSDVPDDLVEQLFMHLPDADLGAGWVSQVPGPLLSAALYEIVRLREVIQDMGPSVHWDGDDAYIRDGHGAILGLGNEYAPVVQRALAE